MILKLGHVGLTVSDLDRAKRFYCMIFGFEEFFRVRRRAPWLAAQVGYEDADIEFCHLRHPTAGIHIELLKYNHPSSTNPLPDDTYRPGSVHVNLWVDDVRAIVNALASYVDADLGLMGCRHKILDIDATTITEGPQAGGKGFYLRDPDGHTIEVWQPAKTAAAQGFGK